MVSGIKNDPGKMTKQCRNCDYFCNKKSSLNTGFGTYGICNRYPHTVEKTITSWCGEFKKHIRLRTSNYDHRA